MALLIAVRTVLAWHVARHEAATPDALERQLRVWIAGTLVTAAMWGWAAWSFLPFGGALQQIALILVVYTFCVASHPDPRAAVRALSRVQRTRLPAGDRARGAGRRHARPADGGRDGGGDGDDARPRAQLPRRLRASEPPASPERGADRAVARGEGCRRRGAARGRGRQPREDQVLRRRQPRPAPAAARDGPVCRGAAPAQPARRRGGARSSTASTTRSTRSRACSPNCSTSRASRAAGSRSARSTSRSATSFAACACTSSRRPSTRGLRCAFAAASGARTPTRCSSSASCATCSPTRSATAATAACSSRAGAAAERLLLQVWDTGPGIAADEQRRIFEEFYQVPGAAPPGADQRKGLGLGLAIVQRLAALIGEPVQLRSTPGRGSVFSFSLPGATSPARRRRARARPARARRDAGRQVDPRRRGRRRRARRARGAAAGLGCARAARSTPSPRRWTRRRARARAQPPDLLVVDYRLEGARTGVEAIAALRTAYGARLPAIVVTGSTMTDLDAEAERDGFHVMVKPVVPAQLRAMIGFKLGLRAAGGR